MRRLDGKVAVVTAAGQGIGRAIAERFIAEGAEVHASDLSGKLLDGLDAASTETLDGTDREAVDGYFGRFERLDVLAHAIGWVHQGTIEECDPEDWRRSLSITLDSAYHALRAAVPRMKENGGSIVTVASVIGAAKGMPRRAAYGAAKAGVVGLTKSVAADYVTHGIRANCVAPGTVDTPSLRQRIKELEETFGDADRAWRFFIERQPTERFGHPSEIAAAVAFLASDEAALFTGQVLGADGGMTI